MTTDGPLRGVISSLTKGARTRHSPLYVWMRAHHAQLASTMAANGVHWPDLTKALVEAGLVDRNGNPPTLWTAQKTWYRVQHEMAGKRSKSAAKSAPVPNDIRMHVAQSKPPKAPPPSDPPTGGALSPAVQAIRDEMAKRSGR